MKLLIADDEAVIRKGLLSLDWQSIGMDEVYAAKDGLEAKAYLLGEKIDIIISDIRMPGMNGLELAAYIHTYGLDVAVVLLTGFSEFDYALEALRNQVHHYLLKPVKPKDILKTVAVARDELALRRARLKIVEEYQQAETSGDVQTQIQTTFARSRREVLEILRYLADHYAENISLQMLSEHFHFSTSYISRIIKRDTGSSFIDILNAIRLFESLTMLRRQHLRIADVCEKTGFANQHYFSVLFKKVFGISPVHYRKLPEEDRSLRRILESIERNR